MPEKIETGYELLVIKGEDRGRVFPLQYREMHIGRKSHPDATDVDWVFLMDATVSRHHASVLWDDGRHKFVLHHRSRTNPTLVNGQSVQQIDLDQDDTVQLGMLTFKVVFKLKRSMVEAAARITSPLGGTLDTGFTLSVIDGPDLGATYKLDQTVMPIGRRHGTDDRRGGQAVLLNDPTIPFEQVMLTWQEREKTYGILQSERSSVPTVVYRDSVEGPQQVVLDSVDLILLMAEDTIRMGHTTMQLHSRQALRESAERRRAAIDPGRMAPMEGMAPMAGPLLPSAPSLEAGAPPRLPAAPYTDSEHLPPRFHPPLGTRRTEPIIDNTHLRGMGLPAAPPAPPQGSPRTPTPPSSPPPTDMLANRSWPRLSGESAAAAQGMGDDPYPAAYAGWPPAPIEVSGGPSPWTVPPPNPGPAWVQSVPSYSDSGSRRGTGFQAVPSAPMPTPGWAEPAPASHSTVEPDHEHEYQEHSPESAFEAPEPPAPVLRRNAPRLWSRPQGRPRTTDPLPPVVPVKRAEPEDVPAEEPPPRQVRRREPVTEERTHHKAVSASASEEKPPSRPRRPPAPVFESFEEEPQAPVEPESTSEVWSEPPPRAAASALPWGKTSAARRQNAVPGKKPEVTERSKTFLGLSNDAARAAATRVPRIIGEPARPPSAPPRKELLSEDFGARVVQPPRRTEEDEGPRPMETWAPPANPIKKPSRPTAGAAPRPAAPSSEPRPISIIGLGGSNPPRPPASVRNAPPMEEEDFDSLVTGGGWRFQADFVLGFLEGPNQGSKVELLTDDLEDGQEITIGKRGARTNDIELNDAQVANEQAVLRFHENHFSLTNQSRSRQIQVDKLVLGQDEEMLLKHGDKISIGQSKIIFMERSTVEALIGFELAILTGLPQDHGRRFDIIKERTSIGRGPDSDVAPHDDAVSRKHATLQFREGAFFLMNESVSAPTFVNGVSLPKGRERKLALGDKIQISKATTLVFRAKGSG